MITTTEDSLLIEIKDTSPAERKNWIIAAIAAAVRWYGNADKESLRESDGENLAILAQLQEEMVN